MKPFFKSPEARRKGITDVALWVIDVTIGFVEDRSAHTVDEYLQIVKNLRNLWRVPKAHELWFRAEDAKHHRTRLQPGVYRPRATGQRKSADRLLQIEYVLYDDFVRCATQLADVGPGEDWEWDWYFLMQHHGVPTRLLDWSDGALIALHFGVRDKPFPPKSGSIIYVLNPYWLLKKLNQHPDRKDAIDRWKQHCQTDPNRLDPDEWDRLYLPADKKDRKSGLDTPEIPLLWDSPHLSRRVAAQRSRFMIFGKEHSWLTELTRTTDSQLESIRIPVGSINKIRQQLRDAGVTESVVYPDLDGLGRELNQLWQERR